MSVQQSDTIVGADGNPALKLVNEIDDGGVREPDTLETDATPESQPPKQIGMGIMVDPTTGLMRMHFSEPISHLDLMPPEWLAICMALMENIRRLMLGTIEAPNGNEPLQDIPPVVRDQNTPPPYAHKD